MNSMTSIPPKCFISIFKTDKIKAAKAFDKAINKVYRRAENIPVRTIIKLSEMGDIPQIEITGSAKDRRCAFCKYFRQIIGENKTKRNNCPFQEPKHL